MRMDQERFDSIRLARTPRIGPVTFRHLIARFGGATEALGALPHFTRRGRAGFDAADEAEIEREVMAVAAVGARHVIWGDADYPVLLCETEDAPPVLTCAGDIAISSQRCVAMVGARNASAAACRFARDLARDLTAEGLIVVSGLARGIDTAAHQGAGVRTTAVIASGIDIVYPPENAALQERVANEGLLIAEQPPGTAPKAQHFPHRNRIIAGLSLATVVVEAAPRSGSLITARLAGDYGREVLAVPGSPLDPRARGCNELIREGAILVQSAADIVEAISRIDPRNLRSPSPAVDFFLPSLIAADEEDFGRIEQLLGPVPVPVDELVRQSGFSPGAVQTMLLDLELGGRLERHAGGRVSLI